MFYHAHEINGKLHYHSHFYWLNELSQDSEAPVKSHSHTDGQLSLIALLNEITWTSELNLPEIPTRIKLLFALVIQVAEQPHYSYNLLNYNLRAPPVF